MKQKCFSLCFSILPSLPLCFPLILLSLFCPSADFRIPCIPPHCGSKSPSISISLIVAATVSSVLGVGVILLFTAALFILRLRYKRTHSKVKWRKKPEYEGVPPEPRISPNKQLNARHSPLLLRQMANTPHFDGTRRQFYSAESMLSGICGLSDDDNMSCPSSHTVSSYQGEDNGNGTCVVLEEDPSQFDNSELVAGSISVTNEANVSSDMVAFIDNADHPQDKLSNGCHQRQDSSVSHTSSSTHHSPSSQTTNYGLFGEFSEHHGNRNPTPYLCVPHPNPGSEGSTYDGWQRSNTGESVTFSSIVSTSDYYSNVGSDCLMGDSDSGSASCVNTECHNYTRSIRHSPELVSQTNSLESESFEIINSVLREAVGCLMLREDCQIPRCPCRPVKVRFNSLMVRRKKVLRVEDLRREITNSKRNTCSSQENGVLI